MLTALCLCAAAKVKKLMPHHARDVNMTNAARVFDDRRSGRHLDAARATAAPPEQIASALALVAEWAAKATAAATAAAAQVAAEHAADAAATVADVVVEAGGSAPDAAEAATAAAADAAAAASARTAQRAAAQFIPATLALLARSALITAAPSTEAKLEAAAIYERLRTIAVVTSDYAAQIETQRKYTGTCASRERHNFLVSVVCYKPYMQTGGQRGSKAVQREPEYKQHVDVFFAFHKAGFKPSARSFNVVQEDIDHWLKYGSMLHGEWFVDGERCPGGDHRLPLPEGLSERPVRPPDFPEMTGRRDKFDGCPNQFAYGTNYHQIAEWLTKTARWPVAAAAAATHLASQCDAAAAAAERVSAAKAGSAAHATAASAAAAAASAITSSTARGFPDPATHITSCAPSTICTSVGRVAAATLRAATATSAAETSTAAKAARSVCKAVATAATAVCTAAAEATPSTAGIRRSSSKQVEYHGKGSCDAEGNVPKHALQDAIAKGKLFNPGTRELVLYLAQNKQAPSILKEHKSGWEAAGRFFWGYMNTDRFTKFAVPEATVKGFPNSKKQHEFDGFCADQQLAEKSGRLGARPMWCVCPPCLLGKFGECEMVAEMGGPMRTVSAPLAAGVQERQPQMQSLEVFGDKLEAGMIVAFNVDKDDLWMEGPYWLVKLLGPAFPAPSELVHAGSVFEEGWLIVQGQYYKLEQTSERGYRLLPQKRYFVVNSMIRLMGVSFCRSQGGPQHRVLRPNPTGPEGAGRKEGIGGLCFLSEDMHNMLLSCCAAIIEQQNALCEPDVYSPIGELLNPPPAIEYDVEDMEPAPECPECE